MGQNLRVATVLLAVLLPLPCGRAAAQEVLWERRGILMPNYAAQVVKRASFLADLDGDGVQDVAQLVNATGGSLPVPSPSQIWFLSGATGQVLRTFTPTAPQLDMVYIARLDDLDGDGKADYAVQRRDRNALLNIVDVRSGRDDALLWQVSGPWIDQFGDGLASADLDGDGKSDLLVASPNARPGTGLFGEISAYDSSGRFLYRVVPIAPFQRHWP